MDQWVGNAIMWKSAAAAAVLSLFAGACGTPSGPGPDGLTRGPAPYGALTSADAALEVVFDQVCLPAILDGGDFVTLARSHYLVETKAPKNSTGQSAQAFRLASMSKASATLWADGTCTVGLEKADTSRMAEHMLATLSARGQGMTVGVSRPADRGGIATAYCNSDLRPLILVIVRPGDGKSKRPAVVANLHRAVGGASDICSR